jgi:hypothetical protein
VVGIEFTDAGVTLQLPLPETKEHVRLIVPVNPFAAVTLIGPLVVLLPAFTVGKEPVSLSPKSGAPLRICSSALATCVVWFESEPTP